MPRPYLAVPVFNVGWNESPSPSMEPGPFGREMLLGETPFLSAANVGKVASVTSSPNKQRKATGGRDRGAVEGWLFNVCLPFVALIVVLLLASLSIPAIDQFLLRLVEFIGLIRLPDLVNHWLLDGLVVIRPHTPLLHQVVVSIVVRQPAGVAQLVIGGPLHA